MGSSVGPSAHRLSETLVSEPEALFFVSISHSRFLSQESAGNSEGIFFFKDGEEEIFPLPPAKKDNRSV